MYLSASIHGHQLPCIVVKTKNHQQQGARYAPTPLGNISRTTAAVVLEGDGSFSCAASQRTRDERNKQTRSNKEAEITPPRAACNCRACCAIWQSRFINLTAYTRSIVSLHDIYCASYGELTYVYVNYISIVYRTVYEHYVHLGAGNQLFFLAVEHVGVRCATG